jgi:hypothetical protein
MRFFPKGLNPFKIQAGFKLDLFLEILIQNPEGFGSWNKKETFYFCIYLPPYQVLNFFYILKVMICNFEV